MTDALLGPEGIARLPEALTAADHTVAGIRARIGETATEAASGFLVPVRREASLAKLHARIDLLLKSATAVPSW